MCFVKTKVMRHENQLRHSSEHHNLVEVFFTRIILYIFINFNMKLLHIKYLNGMTKHDL